MQPSPESGVDDLVAELVRRVEVPDRVQVPGRPGGVEAVNVQVDLVRAQEGADYLGHRRRVHAVRSGVFGVTGVVKSGRQPVCSTVAGLPSS